MNGPLLQSEAQESSIRNNYPGFTASNRWLQSFCTRHQIKMANLHGESAEVSQQVVQQWHEELPSIIRNYDLRDIFNCDETSIFFRAIPTKSFVGQGEAHRLVSKYQKTGFLY